MCKCKHVFIRNMQHPFTCIVSGPTGSGKSVLTLKLIQHAQQVITPPPERIMYCYGEYQKVVDNSTILM